MEWYNNKYANFSGRATRQEYAIWFVSVFLIYILAPLIPFFTSKFLSVVFNSKVLSFLLIIPISAATVRRIRDLGFNGGFVFLNFIPYVNFLFVLSLLIVKGEDKKNAYGENPYELEILEE